MGFKVITAFRLQRGFFRPEAKADKSDKNSETTLQDDEAA